MAWFCDQLAQENLASAFVYLLLSVSLRGEHIYVGMYQGLHTRKRHMADSSAILMQLKQPPVVSFSYSSCSIDIET